MDPQAEVKFWKTKYFELLLHTTQVSTMLGREFLSESKTPRVAGTQ